MEEGLSAADALFARYRDHGDVDALGRFFDATAPTLFRVAVAICVDAHEAEDVLQETFLAAIGAAPRYDPSRRVLPWMIGILKHKAAHVRRRRTPVADSPADVVDRAPTPPEAVSSAERSSRVDAHLEALPEPLRTTALLRWRHGLEPSEIAALRRERPSTVRVRLHRILVRLRSELRGLAGIVPFVGADGPRGLAAVRARVLIHGGKVRADVVTVTAAGVTGGAIMGNLIATAVCLAIVAAAAWIVAPRGALESETEVSGVDVSDATRTDHMGTRAPSSSPSEDVSAGHDTPIRAHTAVSGRVVTRAGRPLSGVVVRALKSSGHHSTRPETPLRSVTGEDGAFRVVVSDAGGTYTLVAEHEEHGADCALDVPAHGRRDLALLGTTDVVGSVVDVDGRTVGSAAVTGTVLAGTLARTHAVALRRSSTTDAEGRFRLRGLPVGGTGPWGSQHVAVGVTAAGYPQARISVPLARAVDASTRADVVLRRGGRVVGTVKAADTGAPVPRALVECGTRGTPGANRESRWDPARSVRTNSRGEFALEAVGLRRGHVRVWAPGWAAAVARFAIRADGDTHRVMFGLYPAGAVVGRVLDHEQRVVSDAHVVLRNDDAWFPNPLEGAPPGRVRTGDDGTYRLDGVAAGPGAPSAKIYGAPADWTFSPGAVDLERLQSPDVDVAVGLTSETHAPDLVLPPPPAAAPLVTVSVVDAAGVPIARAAVQAGSARPSLTAADGVATVGVPPIAFGQSRRPRLRVSAAGFAPVFLPLGARDSWSEPRTVTLQRGRVVRGRLLDHQGDPVPWTEVTATCGRSDSRVTITATTDRRGRFELHDVPTDPCSLVAYMYQGPALPNLVAAADDVVPDTADTLLTFPPPPEPLGSLSIAVRSADTDGAVFSPRLTLHGADGRQISEGFSATPGRIEHPWVPAGAWTMVVSAPGYLPVVKRDVTVGTGPSTRVALRLERGSSLDGRAVTEAGPVAPGTWLQLLPVHTQISDELMGLRRGHRVLVGAQGSFRVSGVEPGRYRAVVSVPRATALSADPILEVGDDVNPVVRLRPAGRLAVEITDPSLAFSAEGDAELARAAPRLEEIRIEVVDAAGDVVLGYAGVMTEWAGPASRCVLAPGAYVVRLLRADGRIDEQAVTVAPGAEVRATFGPQ